MFISSCGNSSQEAIKEKRQEEMQNKENRVSPPATASATIGTNTITIVYSSPLVKGRPIWGELVKYDEVWRTGANEATTITFTQDVTIEGQNLPKGTYSLFTIPTAEQWTIIFNVNETQWGAFKYDQSEDALRVSVKPLAVDAVQENLLFEVMSDSTPNSGIVRLRWEKLQVDFHFVNAAE
ncbi:MAG: DUF2911 domain-containing protein [Bacteroidetes bacterium]|nr:DUF2911 domain-containing protein [Bacteroidota bacterium]